MDVYIVCMIKRVYIQKLNKNKLLNKKAGNMENGVPSELLGLLRHSRFEFHFTFTLQGLFFMLGDSYYAQIDQIEDGTKEFMNRKVR